MDLQRQAGPVELKFDFPSPSKPAEHGLHSSVLQRVGRWGKKLDALATSASAFPRRLGAYSSISEAVQCTKLMKANQWRYIKHLDILSHVFLYLALLQMRQCVYKFIAKIDEQWKVDGRCHGNPLSCSPFVSTRTSENIKLHVPPLVSPGGPDRRS